VPQYFTGLVSASLALEPIVYGAADVRFTDATLGVDSTRSVAFAAPMSDGPIPVDWQAAERVEMEPHSLQTDPPAGATYAPLPGPATKAKHYATWTKQLTAWLSANETLELMKCPSSGDVSRPDESERDFRARVQQHRREARDEAVEDLRRKYGPKVAALDEKLRRAKLTVEKESQQAAGANLQTVISVGATLASVLLGRKAMSVGALGRATTAARGVGRSMKEREDIQRAEESVSALDAQRQQLEADLDADTQSIEAATSAAIEKLERVALKPKRGQVNVKLVALVWR
jgi:hypothetical protein